MYSRQRVTFCAVRRRTRHEWSVHRDHFADIRHSLRLPGELLPGADQLTILIPRHTNNDALPESFLASGFFADLAMERRRVMFAICGSRRLGCIPAVIRSIGLLGSLIMP